MFGSAQPMKLVPAAHSATGIQAPLLPLEARGLTLDIDGVRLVDGIDLVLSRDELTVVMGPNGAGKSLLLRLMHGLVTPSAGMLAWAGMPMSAEVRRRQSMVFQRPVLLRRSVAANIDFALKVCGRPRSRAAREELLARVSLLERARQPARALSVGEQQRLALARALANEPAVLFLDEPTASLDPRSTAMIEQLVRAAHAQGTKIVFVTHDAGQARRIADEVVFLHRGRLVEQTPAQRFFEEPQSTEGRDYLEGRLVL